MDKDPYAGIARQLNWDAPEGPVRCTACSELGEPRAGSYSSSLKHLENVMGPLPGKRTDARLLILFQDPRRDEDHFTLADPDEEFDGSEEDLHRSFVMTQPAWNGLGLEEETGSAAPVWPSEDTSHAYLHRYFSRGGSWSYDGFVSYFLHLFKPQKALVTNAAKCHFSKDAVETAAETCVQRHLLAEAKILRPNVVLSFARIATNKIKGAGGPLSNLPVITLFHPASRTSDADRVHRFEEQVQKRAEELAGLGVDTDAMLSAWERDCRRLNVI